MPILMEFVRVVRPLRVLELGCGFYSTRLFLDHCATVVSIESDSDVWFDKMERSFGARANWCHAWVRGLGSVCAFIRDAQPFDLIFVDGDVHRAEETNVALEHAQHVIGHDTQGWQHDSNATAFLRDHYRVPSGFHQTDFKQFPVRYGAEAGCDDRPWTTLFTRDPRVHAHFQGIEIALYERHRFPYVYETCPNHGEECR